MSRAHADQLVDVYLAEAGAADAQADVRLYEDVREDVVVRGSGVESANTVRYDHVALRLWTEDGVSTAAFPATVDPATAVRKALAHVHRSGVATALPGGPSLGIAESEAEPPPTVVGLCAAVLEALTDVRELMPEVRLDQLVRAVTVADSAGRRRRYRTSTASLLARLTRPNASEQGSAHIDRADYGPDAAALIGRLRSRTLPPCTRAVRAEPLPATQALPEGVLFEAPVAARLLALYARGLCGDAVAQGRSRLADRIGKPVASELLTIVDDPSSSDAPWRAPFDDEGTATARRVLVQAGVLTGFLGSGQTAAELGRTAAAGNAWQSSPSLPPRPAPGNLTIEARPVPGPEPDQVIRVVQIHGLHLSNDITGDFSLGALGLVADGDGELTAVDVTVAGNVYELFQRAVPLESVPSWWGGSASFCGAQDLLVPDGLAVGR